MKKVLSALFILLGLCVPVFASRDLASTNYMDGGTAANTAASLPMTVAVCVKLDAIGTMQVPIFRGTTALTNGWDFRVLATGFLSWFNYESDSADGTSTTQVSALTWTCIGMVMSTAGASGNIHFVRFDPATGTLVSQNVTMFNGPSPSGTHKLLIGGRWNGALANSAPGDYARAAVASGAAWSDAELQTWFCTGVPASGGDGIWELAGVASPEPDASGNSYSLTLSGTSSGSALTACPSASSDFPLPFRGGSGNPRGR